MLWAKILYFELVCTGGKENTQSFCNLKVMYSKVWAFGKSVPFPSVPRSHSISVMLSLSLSFREREIDHTLLSLSPRWVFNLQPARLAHVHIPTLKSRSREAMLVLDCAKEMYPFELSSLSCLVMNFASCHELRQLNLAPFFAQPCSAYDWRYRILPYFHSLSEWCQLCIHLHPLSPPPSCPPVSRLVHSSMHSFGNC